MKFSKRAKLWIAKFKINIIYNFCIERQLTSAKKGMGTEFLTVNGTILIS